MPSTRLSFTPVTVTVCGTFQLPTVNTRLDLLTVPSVGSPEEMPTVTSASGCDMSTTVKPALPPASVVVRPDTGVTLTPAVSSSVMVAVTCWEPDSVPLVTVEMSTTICSASSSTRSLTPVRVIEAERLPAGTRIAVPDAV